jgi:hypothetical protein
MQATVKPEISAVAHEAVAHEPAAWILAGWVVPAAETWEPTAAIWAEAPANAVVWTLAACGGPVRPTLEPTAAAWVATALGIEACREDMANETARLAGVDPSTAARRGPAVCEVLQAWAAGVTAVTEAAECVAAECAAGAVEDEKGSV